MCWLFAHCLQFTVLTYHSFSPWTGLSDFAGSLDLVTCCDVPVSPAVVIYPASFLHAQQGALHYTGLSNNPLLPRDATLLAASPVFVFVVISLPAANKMPFSFIFSLLFFTSIIVPHL